MSAQQMPNEGEAARRRLVIIHALHDLLSQSEQQQAIALWDQSFSQSRAFAIVSFVTRLDERIGLGPRTAAVQRSLTQRMFMREDELSASANRGTAARSWTETGGVPAAPPEMLQALASPVAPPVSSPATVVFGALLEGVIRRIERRMDGGTSSLVRFLKRNLAGTALGAPARSAFSAWCDTSQVDSRLDLTETSDMKAVIHTIYLFACDALGPLIADRLFNKAVREVEELPEASRFSPRDLF